MRIIGIAGIVALMLAFSGSTAAQTPPPALDGAKWVWCPPDATETPDTYSANVVYFRATLDLPDGAKVKYAEAIMTADNLCALHVNGKAVGQSDHGNDGWRKPRRYVVTETLVPGRNVIAIEAINTAPSPAGLLVKLIVQADDDRQIVLCSGPTWKQSEKEFKDWHLPAFDDKDWRGSYVIGDYGTAPWGRIIASPTTMPANGSEKDIDEVAKQVRQERASAPITAPLRAVETAAPVEYAWPEGVAFVGDDCSLYRLPTKANNAYESLTVTIFNPRHARAYPEHDLPAPMKIGRKLYALKPARPGTEPRVILDAGKGALGSPSASFDGKWMYVSMARDSEPFFHIYRVSVDGGEAQRLTNGPFHDIDPAELPDGRIVFTSTRIGTFEEYHSPPSRALFVMNQDGSDIHPITSTIIFDNEPKVMADGRILFIRSDNFFDRGKVETLLHAVHPDGTEGYTEFGLDNAPEYNLRLRQFVCGSPAPLPDGRVAFVSDAGITIAMPGLSPRNWRNVRMDAGDVAALPDGRMLSTMGRRVAVEVPVGNSMRTMQDHRYMKIVIVEEEAKTAKVIALYDSPGAPLHSPVFMGARTRPPVLAEKVDRKKAEDPRATGVLYCQNARFTQNTTAGWSHVRAVRVIAGTGLTTRSSHSYLVHAGNETVELGTVPLAPDGSFAVEVPADTPIAFQAVDAEGRSELNEMSWIYVRPGESRGCLGCHHTRQATPPLSKDAMQSLRTKPMKLVGQGQPHRFRGNNPAVTGLMEMQLDRFREVAGINRHSENPDPLATGAKDVELLIGQLKSPDGGTRLSAAQRLAIFRDQKAAKTLGESLEDEDRDVRIAAAMALATCGTRDSAPLLLGALTDADPLVAQAAAIAMENITGHSEAFNPFVKKSERAAQAKGWRDWFAGTNWDKIEQDLVQRVGSKDRDIVRRAAVALGHVGGAAAKGSLRAYVARERETNPLPEWRKKHQGDQARFNATEAVNPRTLQAAVRALGYLKDAEAIPMLAETIAKHANPDNGNVFVAETALEAMALIGTPEAEAAMIAAFTALRDYPTLCAWYGDHGALMACHASPLHYFVTQGLDAMGSSRVSAIVPHLIRSIPTDTDRALFAYNDDCETLIGRLIRRSDKAQAVIETCLSILGDANAAKAKEIEEAIRQTHGAWGGKPGPEHRAAQVLSLVCRDRKYEPRIRAAFERYRGTSTDIKRLYDTGIPVINALPVKHWVCFFLARSLGNLADPQSVDALIAALDSPTESAPGYPDPLGPGVLFLHNDLTPCWRAAAAWAIGRIGDKRAVPTLLKVAGDLGNATDTRHAAARALGRIADPASMEAIRKLAADYPEISTKKALQRACEAGAAGTTAQK